MPARQAIRKVIIITNLVIGLIWLGSVLGGDPKPLPQVLDLSVSRRRNP